MIGPLSYIGGKRRIAKQLVALIPAHITYVEPFAGGAQVFFQKPRSRVEVLNDLDAEIVNFLRICQRHPCELSRILRWQPASRRIFDWHNQQSPDTLTDVERAARFYFLQKNTWGGKRMQRNFHFSVSKPPSYSPHVLAKRLVATAERLDGTQIESAPYELILDRYDRKTTFFYCDPPYVGVDLYQHTFTDEQFLQLARHLRALTGQFLLSINDCPKARTWFGGFHRLEITVSYTAIHHPRRFRSCCSPITHCRQRSRDLDIPPLIGGVKIVVMHDGVTSTSCGSNTLRHPSSTVYSTDHGRTRSRVS